MNLALFDFDGTISNKDSLIEFIKYLKGTKALLKGIIVLSPYIALYKMKLLNSQIMKESFLKYFIKDMDEDSFRSKATEFSLNILSDIIKKEALDRIKWHKDNNDRIIIVSASLECTLKPWCDCIGVELIATKLSFFDRKFTGRLHAKNCIRKEKVRKILQIINIQEYDKIYAYGNSNGDKKMLELANERYYKIF